MAKVINPLMSQAARGKVGGIVFNQWRGFAVVKGLRSPTQPNTPAQLNARARLASCSAAWGALSSTERAAWQQYAIDHLETDWTGQPKRLTSQNWFVRCTTRLLLVGGAQVDTPPATVAPAAPADAALACAGGAGTALTFDWTTPADANVTFLVYHAGPLSAGRIPRFEQASILTTLGSQLVGAQTLIAQCPAGRHGVWVVAVSEVNGLASAPIFVEITVV